MLLDVILPGKDGLAIRREIRKVSRVPIVMLTAKADTLDVGAGLEAGADDYWPSRSRARAHRPDADPAASLPQHPPRAADRRHHHRPRRTYRHPPRRAAAPHTLEFDLLTALARQPEHVFTRDDLLHQVWGYHEPNLHGRLVNVHIQRLRAKIEHHPGGDAS